MFQFWLDTETTGLDSRINSLWQIGAAVFNKDKLVDSFEGTMNPPAGCVIEDKALEVGGVTRADLASFGTQDELYEKFLTWALPYRNKMGKLTIAGWNADFDKPFVEAFFNRCAGGSSFSQVFYHYTISPYAFARILLLEDAFKERYGNRPLNLKLGSLAKWLKIDTSAFRLHSALSDAILAKQVYEKLKTDFLYHIPHAKSAAEEFPLPPECLPEPT